MTFPATRVRRAILLRSFLVQGSWNYETLIGTGFAFTLLPALRLLYVDDAEGLRRAVERHASLFNSHPYLAPVAAGAVARLEADGVDPHTVERFKGAMRGSLGSLGDQLFWSAWRPASLLLALALLLAGAAWWVGLSVFLLLYNVLHLGIRAWGLRVGAEAGLEVGKVLRAAPLQELARRAADVGAVLCGFTVVLPLAPLSGDPLHAVPVAGAAGLGLWLGLATRRIVAAGIALAWLVALLSAWIT